MVVGDSIRIPVNITNLGTTPITTRLTETASNGTVFRIQSANPVLVAAGQTVQTFLTATALSVSSNAVLNVVAAGNSTGNRLFTASTRGSINVVDVMGVRKTQVRGAFVGSNVRPTTNSSNLSNVQVAVNLTNDLNQSSSQWTFAVYPSAASLIDSSIAAVADLPQGNFEQVAS